MKEISHTDANMPRHIAIIMDGNGRWAQQRDLPRVEGHRAGVASVRKVTEDRWRKAFGWMREHGLVPSGYGSLAEKEASR